MVKCDNYGTDNTTEDKFCCICGKPLNHEKTTNNSVNNSKLNLKICNNCGAENNDEDMFCNQCGGPLNKDETTNNETSDRKFNLKLIIPVIAIVLVAIVGFTMMNGGGMGMFGGNDVTVKNVKIQYFWGNVNPSNDKMYNMYQIGFEFVSNVNMNHIKSIELHNVEVTFDGKIQKFNNCGLDYDKDLANNGDFKYLNSMLKDDYYIFNFKLKDKNFHDSNSISHIKADIVVNTTTQDNIVIGHIDDDISMSTAKTNNRK